MTFRRLLQGDYSALLGAVVAIGLCTVDGTVAAAQRTTDLSAVYGRGVHAYFAGQTFQADRILSQVIGAGSQDPRVFYFRGLARLRQGRHYEAEQDMRIGAAYEARRAASTYDVGRALTRVQGSQRQLIERFRREAQLAQASARNTRQNRRYQRLAQDDSPALRQKPVIALDSLLQPSIASTPQVATPGNSENAPPADPPAGPGVPSPPPATGDDGDDPFGFSDGGADAVGAVDGPEFAPPDDNGPVAPEADMLAEDVDPLADGDDASPLDLFEETPAVEQQRPSDGKPSSTEPDSTEPDAASDDPFGDAESTDPFGDSGSNDDLESLIDSGADGADAARSDSTPAADSSGADAVDPSAGDAPTAAAESKVAPSRLAGILGRIVGRASGVSDVADIAQNSLSQLEEISGQPGPSTEDGAFDVGPEDAETAVNEGNDSPFGGPPGDDSLPFGDVDDPAFGGDAPVADEQDANMDPFSSGEDDAFGDFQSNPFGGANADEAPPFADDEDAAAESEESAGEESSSGSADDDGDDAAVDEEDPFGDLEDPFG